MDVAPHKWSSEAVDEELDRLIEKRSRRGETYDEGPLAREESWKQSVRRYNARQQEENRQAWREHHQRQAACLRATLEDLVARHEEQAERLSED